MNTAIKHEVIGLIASKMQEYKVLADNFVKSRFLLASVEYGQNEEEMQALQKIADGIQCTIYQTDAGIG